MKKKINLIAVSLMLIMISAIIVVPGCKADNSTYAYSTAPSGVSGTQGANDIWMQGMAFNPAAKTISVGTTITWTNKDTYAHTVTSGVPGAPDGIFNSGNLSNGDKFSFKFNTAGTFKYFCTIHGAMMTATMTVQ